MREEPSVELVSLLERLGLATSADLRRVRWRARRLARRLPLFDSVWIDALVAARRLTPYQATEIKAGRADTLAHGDWIVLARRESFAYAVRYAVRHRTTRALGHLWFAAHTGDPAAIAARFCTFAACIQSSPPAQLTICADVGVDHQRMWSAGPAPVGTLLSAAAARRGRISPSAVIEIARQMIVALAWLGQRQLVHGDLQASNIAVDDAGQVTLMGAGLRQAVGCLEHHAWPDELDANFTPARATGDLSDRFAAERTEELGRCAVVWWQLLAGRPISAAGRTGRGTPLADIRRFAGDTPEPLAKLITRLATRDPLAKPISIAEVTAVLGDSTPESRAALAAEIRTASSMNFDSIVRAASRPAGRNRVAAGVAIAAIGIVLAVAIPKFLGVGLHPTAKPEIEQPAPHHLIAEQSPSSTQLTSEPSAEVLASRQLAEPARLSNAAQLEALRAQPLQPEIARQELSASHADVAAANHERPIPQSALSAPQVSPAVHWAAGNPARSAGASATSAPRVDGLADRIVLPPGEHRLRELKLRPGQTVCGPAGSRAVICVPAEGVSIVSARCRFERIDFCFDPRARPVRSSSNMPAQEMALVRLHANDAAFYDCEFVGGLMAESNARAIDWQGDAIADPSTLPGNQLTLVRCVFRQAAVAVDCSRQGTLHMNLTEVLHLGPGPLLRLSTPADDTSRVQLALTRSTLRQCSAVIELAHPEVPASPGEDPAGASEIAVQANQCAMDLLAGSPLVEAANPAGLTAVRWSGEGTVLAPDRQSKTIEGRSPNDQLGALAGVVRSQFDFAGPADGPSSDSRVVRWQVPLHSAEPPGISEVLP